MAASDFTARDLRERLSLAAPDHPVPDLGDHVLNPELESLLDGVSIRDAAVLVPVVDRTDGATVILTTRSAALRKHSGQIAFPGGSVDPSDASPEAAAIRESFEEVGLRPEFIETVGRLPRYSTTTGFRITPVIAVVRPGFELAPNPAEVADVFEVPLAFLMDAANHQKEGRVWNGRERFFYVMPFGERYIWGVTAGIIRTLFERLYA
ncbi:CoA pyrophosphatase [Aureimonas leprariae]|uniref:CoA pyrophosphatase n=1 Tax=Plantimonas leprariae TaxID=2615207 RepID=A0A7V7PPB4_9HYPH|nr:CoA pyrophosphatase [Aureimonas leprariae]KAB0679826.1 CoA pyrophosphatase [Aureimonas leprariae]